MVIESSQPDGGVFTFVTVRHAMVGLVPESTPTAVRHTWCEPRVVGIVAVNPWSGPTPKNAPTSGRDVFAVKLATAPSMDIVTVIGASVPRSMAQPEIVVVVAVGVTASMYPIVGFGITMSAQ